MTDVHSPEIRSKNMAAIKSRDTKPEIIIRKALHKIGFKFRLNAKDLPGKPDLVLPKYKAVIFVNGCFWHRHDCNKFKWPKSRQEFWIPKLDKTPSMMLERSLNSVYWFGESPLSGNAP